MTAADETAAKINNIRQCPDCHGNGTRPKHLVEDGDDKQLVMFDPMVILAYIDRM